MGKKGNRDVLVFACFPSANVECPLLDVVDVGYRFLPEYWGRGLATEACRACLEFGFETLQLERIVAFVLPENQASIRVLEKVGMEPEGTVEMEGVSALKYVIEGD